MQQALKQLLPALSLEELSSVEEELLIQHCAKRTKRPVAQLLEDVAAVFGLPVALELEPVNSQLRATVPYTEEMLRSVWSAPQWTEAAACGYGIATARPDLVDIEAFLAEGRPVWLTTGEEIVRAWTKNTSPTLERSRVSLAQTWATLRRLAAEASRLGASEIFIGHPNQERYEFVAAGARYTGRVHQGLYESLMGVCTPGAPVKRECASEEGISELSVALTKSFERTVVCLSWQVAPGANGKEAADLGLREEIDCPGTAVEGVVTPMAPSKQRVLLVDDDERFLLIVGMILESKGWIVTTSARAEDALGILSSAEFDLVVTDLHMPEMDGAMFLGRIKLQCPTIPVLVLTSDEATEVEAELVLLGADAFVRKQEDPRILLSWCKNLARRCGSARDKELRTVPPHMLPGSQANGSFRV